MANTVESSNYVIIDEYDEVIPYNDFIKLVDEKQKDPYCQNNPDNFVSHCQYVDGYRFDDDDFW